MPCHSYVCEWCDDRGEFRRDRFALHVKTKHYPDIAKQWLDEYREYDGKMDNHSIIHRIMMAGDPRSLPVESKVHEGGEFYFGIKPMFFAHDEDEDRIHYKSSAANMEEHVKNLREIMGHITLNDMIAAKIEIKVRDPATVAVRRRLHETEKELLTLREDMEKKDQLCECMREEIKELREALEVPYAISTMKEELATSKRCLETYRRDIKNLEEALHDCHERMKRQQMEAYESYAKDKSRLEDELWTLQRQHHELEMNVKKKINEGIEKDKKAKERKEDKEKEKEKAAKKKLKKKKEEERLLKLMRAMTSKKGSESDDSESNSSSAESSDVD